MSRDEIRGSGWTIYEKDRLVFIKFNHRPSCVPQLNRSRFCWREWDKVWFAAASDEAWAEAKEIAEGAETWESVGETPPSLWDDCEDPGWAGSD